MERETSDISQTDKKMRFERKFLLRDVNHFHLQNMILLNKGGFSEKYHSRQINNIYFDTPNFDLYSASIKGFSPRRKIRIRWYGDMFGNINNAVLEIKFKEGVVNHKSSYVLGNLDLTQGSKIFEQINKSIDNSQIPYHLLSSIKSLKPVLINQYVRKYYESMNHSIRLTLDWDLLFLSINRYSNYHLNRFLERNLSILELKYDSVIDSGIDKVTNEFPFRLTKCSKYVLGINRVFLFSDLS
jgi:hypothetical protein